MNYYLLHELLKDIEEFRFRDIGINAEYVYLEKELYGIRFKGDKSITFISAKSPDKAHSKLLRTRYLSEVEKCTDTK